MDHGNRGGVHEPHNRVARTANGVADRLGRVRPLTLTVLFLVLLAMVLFAYPRF